MTKTWHKKQKNDRKCWNSRKMKFATNLWFLSFFWSCLLSLSCHCLVIAFLFFNHFFNFQAWKQQNHWTIEENQWKNQRKPTKPLKKTKEKGQTYQWQSEENQWTNGRKLMKTWKNNSDGLKTRMPDATEILKGFQNMTHLECPICLKKVPDDFVFRFFF